MGAHPPQLGGVAALRRGQERLRLVLVGLRHRRGHHQLAHLEQVLLRLLRRVRLLLGIVALRSLLAYGKQRVLVSGQVIWFCHEKCNSDIMSRVMDEQCLLGSRLGAKLICC